MLHETLMGLLFINIQGRTFATQKEIRALKRLYHTPSLFNIKENNEAVEMTSHGDGSINGTHGKPQYRPIIVDKTH